MKKKIKEYKKLKNELEKNKKKVISQQKDNNK